VMSGETSAARWFYLSLVRYADYACCQPVSRNLNDRFRYL
jgi:hypothetical protein